MNVPRLRFTGFKGDWLESRINQITSYVDYRGKTPTKVESGVFLVTAKNVRMGYIDYENSKEFIAEYDYDNVMSRGKPVVGDVLITTEAPMGNIASVDRDDIALAQRVIKLRGIEAILQNEFLKYRLQSKQFQEKLAALSSGGTVKGIKGSVLHKIQVLIPAIGEQQKIASFLSAIDQKISLLTKNHELLLQYKKGVMQKIFNQEIKFRDKGGKDFPGWKSMSLAELGDTYNGLTGKTADDFGVGADYVTYKQIFDSSRIDASKFGCVSIKPGERQNLARYGDLFFTTSSETPNEVGYCSVLLEDVKNLYLNSFCFGYRIKSFEVLSPKFARFMFFSSNVRESIVLLAQGSTRYNISKTNFMKIKVLVPALKEQEKISLFLESLDGKLATVASQLELAKKYKQGLLQQMFI
jgi:type I restriction enzyme S subunit